MKVPTSLTMMIHSSLLLLAAFIVAVVADISSVGKNFEVVFPVNNAESPMDADISLEFVRYGGPVHIEIYYSVFSEENGTLVHTMQKASTSLTSGRIRSLNFDGEAIYQNITVGLKEYPDMRFIIRADDLISVVAHNYAKDGSGDSFMVLPKEMAGTSYAVSIPKMSPSASAAVYFFSMTNDTNIDITVVGETSTKNHTIKTKDNATFVYSGSDGAFSLYAQGNKPYHVVVGVRQYESSKDKGNMTSMNYMPPPLPVPGCHTGEFEFDCISDVKLSNNFIVTPPAMNCSPVVIEVQGNGTEANFTVNPKKPQPIHSWNADHGDIGLLLSNTRHLQCVRLGGGNTKDGKTVGTFMDIMPSWSQFINGTIYVPIRSTKAVLTIIADEDGKNDMYVGSLRLKAEEWNNITYGSKTAYYYSREIFTGTMRRSLYYYNVHSSGHYIAQITGINKNGSSYGYTPALYDTTMDRPKPSEPAPVTTSTSSPSSSSSPSSPSSPSSSSSLSTERISSSTEGSEISTSTPSGTSSPIGQNAVMFAAFAVASLMLQIL